jgi:hypothetical protein
MKMRTTYKLQLMLIFLALAIGTSSVAVAQESDATVKKDLKTVLALQGKACNDIDRLESLGENDYLVTCKDGNRYRIWINADDRVIVEDRK